jgi:hypothetical protein
MRTIRARLPLQSGTQLQMPVPPANRISQTSAHLLPEPEINA